MSIFGQGSEDRQQISSGHDLCIPGRLHKLKLATPTAETKFPSTRSLVPCSGSTLRSRVNVLSRPRGDDNRYQRDRVGLQAVSFQKRCTAARMFSGKAPKRMEKTGCRVAVWIGLVGATRLLETRGQVIYSGRVRRTYSSYSRRQRAGRDCASESPQPAASWS
ncbi:hypothetical protein CALCODRAFT_356430 [Calocera cornea HHB12733]|uniref:Uncharacterized protein n=1 Tax=Calocera cornea HHB12733 TaxID=1353952 RepID=A0A165ENM7_9BASI|nr:hypothetical protein CALCODRAFT_356430 [Calocera cornea HHB12733]